MNTLDIIELSLIIYLFWYVFGLKEEVEKRVRELYREIIKLKKHDNN